MCIAYDSVGFNTIISKSNKGGRTCDNFGLAGLKVKIKRDCFFNGVVKASSNGRNYLENRVGYAE